MRGSGFEPESSGLSEDMIMEARNSTTELSTHNIPILYGYFKVY